MINFECEDVASGRDWILSESMMYLHVFPRSRGLKIQYSSSCRIAMLTSY
jgi:hypothetical protein